MTCHRGDVVLLDYPFSDSTGSKVRPALVVQSDRDNVRLTNTVVALITRNLSRVTREPTQMLIISAYWHDWANVHWTSPGVGYDVAAVCLVWVFGGVGHESQRQ